MKYYIFVFTFLIGFAFVNAAEYNQNSISKFSHIKNDGSVLLNVQPRQALPLSHFTSKNIISLPITKENIEAKCRQFIANNSVITNQNNLHLLSAKLRRNQWYVNFAQMHNGLRVLNANTNLQVFKNGNLLNIKSTYFSEITKFTNLKQIDFVDTLTMKQAAISEINKINSIENLEFTFGEQSILPVSKDNKIDFRLVQEVDFRNKIGNISYNCLIDVETNKLLIRRNQVHNYDYHFNSKVVETEPNAPLIETNYFPNIEIEVNGNKYYADSTGKISTDIDLNNKEAEVKFNSKETAYPSINTAFGYWNGDYYDNDTKDFSFNNLCKISNNVIQNNDDSLLTRIVATHYNSFYKMNNRFLEMDPDFDYLGRNGGYTIDYLIYDGTTFVVYDGDTMWINEEYIVNASSMKKSITFYHPLSSMLQIGQMPSVLYHELGHSITSYIYDDATGSDLYDGAIHEGLADIHSAIMLEYPDVFRGVTSDYSPTPNDRTIKNTLKLGYDDIGEGHYDGQILSGAHWDLAELTSIDFMAELMHFTRFAVPDGETTGGAFTNYLIAMLLTDDDDGNIYNKTPHWNEITTAFDNHNISLESFLSYNYEHTPYKDTKDTSNPYIVELEFSEYGYAPAVVEQVDDIWIQYSTNNGIKDSVLMYKDYMHNNINTFITAIPKMPAGTIVHYYFKVNSPFRDTAYSFELHPNREKYMFLVGFDTLYHDSASDSTNHKFTSVNSCYWQQYYFDYYAFPFYSPTEDKTGEGYVWYCESGYYYTKSAKEFHDSIRLYTSDIYFPTFPNVDDYIGRQMGYYISLYYTCFVDDMGPNANSSLVFSLSKDGEQTWKDILITHNSADSPIFMPWERLLFNVYDYFDSFDSLVLRVRFNGEQNDLTDENPEIMQTAYIDDLNILVGEHYTSITEPTTITNINISPNPTKSNITLTFNLQNAGNTKIIISDILGHELLEIHNAFLDAGQFTKTFSVGTLPKGTYYLKIQNNNITKVEKIIKN